MPRRFCLVEQRMPNKTTIHCGWARTRRDRDAVKFGQAQGDLINDVFLFRLAFCFL
jgi:hypothetical protein